MAIADKFTASSDQLRKLKHGSNARLLETWVSMVLGAASWGAEQQEALEALEALAAHPWLPVTGLSEANWPSIALRYEAPTRAALAAGLRFERVSLPPKGKTPRAAALEENSPPAVHELMDAQGVAPASMAEIERWLPRAITSRHLHSFQHLKDRHWEVCRLAFDPPEKSSLFQQVLLAWSADQEAYGNQMTRASCSHSSRAVSEAMLRDLLTTEIDWEETIGKFLGGTLLAKPRAAAQQFYAQIREEMMEKSLSQSEVRAPVFRSPGRF